MSTQPPDTSQPPSSLWNAIPEIVKKLQNEFLLASIAYLLIAVAIGFFVPGVVDLLGRGFFYLIVILAFLAYVFVRVLTTYERLRQPETPPSPPEPPGGPGHVLVASEPLPRHPEPPKVHASSEALRERYLRELLDRCAHLQMTTIDIKAATRREAAELDLAAVFTDLDVYDVGWEEGVERKRGEPIPDLERADRRLPALAALSRNPRLVLLGDPGSGKSTLVNFVTLCLAGDWLNAPDANLRRLGETWQLQRLLPMRIVLRDYAARGLPQNKGLWKFIGEELAHVETRGGPLSDCLPVLQSYLERENGAILLLDGVDEVPEAHRYRLRLKEAVEQFARDFPHCRILVTSRPYAYQDTQAHLARFQVRTLAPFTPEQVQAFIHRWYEHVGLKDPALGPENAARYAEQLAHAVESNPRLAELAPNPLLLTLMASLHRWREGGSLPERRQELYEQSVKLLLDLWQRPKQLFDAEGNPAGEEYDVFTELGIPQENLRTALNLVAYEAHWKQPALTGTHDIRARDLAGALYEAATDKGKAQGEQRIIQYLINRAGLLIEREQGRVYACPHRTFQEYLAACHLADDPYLLTERLREDDARWREAALLAAAKAVSGSTFAIWTLISVFCPHDWPPPEAPADPDWYAALRAAQALLEAEQHLRIPERQRPLLERLRTWLAELVSGGHLPAPERAAAGDALARLGDPRPGVSLRRDGLPDIAWCEVPAGPFIMGSDKARDPDAYDDESPQHEQPLSYAYRISKYPVTNAQFAAFVGAGGYAESGYWQEAREADVWSNGQAKAWNDDEPRAAPYDFGAPFNLRNHPVVGVTWYEALAFCRWLDEQLHQRGELSEGEHVTLPTEAEWEKAARGTDGWRYPWGDEPDPNRANYDETGIGTTSAVGIFPGGETLYGCLDMSGNVWEWTRSLWGEDVGTPAFEYPYDPKGGREDIDAPRGVLRVLRGGAFNLDRRGVRCACRLRDIPDDRGGLVGFRVLVSPVISPLGSGSSGL